MPRWNNKNCGFQKGHKEYRNKETLKKCSDSLRKVAKYREENKVAWGFKKWKYSGDKHWNWKGGITTKYHLSRNSVRFKKWREKVFERDSYTCSKCGDNKGGNLNPHHISNFAEYPKRRYWLKNGITLCQKCHRKFHNKYGYRYNNIKQLKEFLL